jgi:hypothetical protein
MQVRVERGRWQDKEELVDHPRDTPGHGRYLALIDRLTTVQPPVFVFGGFAEDALLAGRTTRPHDDVDVLVGRADLVEHLRWFGDCGFPDFEIYFEVVPGSPLVYHSALDGIELELGVFDELVPGRPSFVVPADGQLTRVTLSHDSFSHPLSRIDGVPIRTISPIALYQMRAALMRTGAFGPARPKDELAQAQLRTRLLSNHRAEDLEPEFDPYP